MNAKKLSLAAMEQWIARLIQSRRVYAPQARGDRFAYDTLRSPSDLRLDYDVTILSPRKYLMPPSEVLLTYTRDGKFQSVVQAEPIILLGVHPYDVAAISQMDRYFMEDKPDAHYIARRKNIAVIASDVQNACETSFAASMGTATVHDGYDILLTLVGEAYVVETRTPLGEELLAMAGDVQDADAVSLGRREQVWDDAKKLLHRQNLKCRLEDLPKLLEKNYDSPVWAQRAEQCFSCGSCAMVCPSCFCFDVKDDLNWDLNHGSRSRQWDACLLPEFSLVAGGHNFRKGREQRYRHRFYRKGQYLRNRCGFVACVGCGRCAAACTSGIANPVELYNSLLEEQ